MQSTQINQQIITGALNPPQRLMQACKASIHSYTQLSSFKEHIDFQGQRELHKFLDQNSLDTSLLSHPPDGSQEDVETWKLGQVKQAVV